MAHDNAEKFLLPDHIADAVLWGNTRYPQLNTGIDVKAGHAVTDAILKRTLKWRDVSRAKPSQSQVDSALERAAAMHTFYDVSCKLRDTAVQYEPDTFTIDRVIRLTTGAIGTAQTATAHFARSVFNDTSPLPAPNMFDRKSDECQAAETKLAAELFTPIGWRRRKFRPEALALGGLWSASAESLSSSAAMGISTAYRNDFRALSAPDVTRSEWEKIKGRIDQASVALRDVVANAVMQSVPSIEEAAQITLDTEVVATFLADTAGSKIIVPPMPGALYKQSLLEG